MAPVWMLRLQRQSMTSFLDESHTKLRMRTLNGAFGPGTYKVSMYVSKGGQLQKVEKEFIID